MTYETLHSLTRERLLERMSAAQQERLALQLRTPRYRRTRRRIHVGALGHLLATRRHALR